MLQPICRLMLIISLLLRSQSIFNYDLARWLYGQPCNA